MPSARLLTLLLTAAVATSAGAAQVVHQWNDEDGQTVYSQFAPLDGRATRLIEPPPPPAEPPEVAQQRLQGRLQQFEDNREDQELARDKTATADTQAEQLRQRCDDARRNLEVLDGPPRMLFQTENGVRRLTEEERQARRAEMQKILDQECR